MRAGYESIASVKRLKRTHVPEAGFINTSPLGIILAVDSALSIKEIAELVVRENADRFSTEWPDMIAVLTKGTVNYAAQIEGSGIEACFTLPNFTSRVVPPMYVHIFMRGVGPLAFNTMCGLLFMHLLTFSPGTNLPNSKVVLDGISKTTRGQVYYHSKRPSATLSRLRSLASLAGAQFAPLWWLPNIAFPLGSLPGRRASACFRLCR